MSQTPEPFEGNSPVIETKPGFRPVCYTVITDSHRNLRECKWSPRIPFATEPAADAALNEHFHDALLDTPQPTGSVVQI